MSAPITIQPFVNPVRGAIRLPGSKSITNRALILSALSSERVVLEGALLSDDTRYMVAALQALGLEVQVNQEQNRIAVRGGGGRFPRQHAELYVGNAGTAARFLTAMLTLQAGGTYQLDGSAAMRKRPMAGLLSALRGMDAAEIEFSGETGYFPFTLRARGLAGGEWRVDAAASSQILSAMLMVAPLASAPVKVVLAGTTVSQPFVGMTLAMMAQFGQVARAESDLGPFSFAGGGHYAAPQTTYTVEPDATAASYFMLLPKVVGGALKLLDTYTIQLQGDIRFAEVLTRIGAFFDVEGTDLIAKFRDRPDTGLTENFNAISDTFLGLAAIAPLLGGPTLLTGIAHTRKQETDRIAAMATELSKLGQQVTETDDSLRIVPDVQKLQRLTAAAPLAIDTYEDHRVAMSFAILGCYDLHGDGRPWLTINDPLCCAKTFPDFFAQLHRLYAESHR